MRPLKLRMKAFGPFAQEVVLDMEKLGEQGTYLITGNTGSGKTSIFDGITYALYGETSGGVRSGEMMRSTFAGPEDPTEVELEFAYGGRTYRIFRSPAYERKKKKGEGTTRADARCELILTDGRKLTNEREVTAAIVELLGVDRAQFTQIAMIAQGDFRRLIFAGTDERIKIFRHLFKTERYEDLTAAIKKEASLLEETRDERIRRIEMLVGDLEAPENVGGEMPDPAAASEPGHLDVSALEKKILDGDRDSLERTAEILEVKEKEIEALQKQIARIEEAEKMTADLEKAREQQTVSEDKFAKATEALTEAERKIPRIDELKKEAAIIEDALQKGAEEEQRELLKQETLNRKREEEHEAAAREYDRLADISDELQRQCIALRRQLMNAQAGILAQELIDGEACPVCGSKEHPKPAKLSADAPTEDEVEKFEKKSARAKKEADEANLKASNLKALVTAQKEETEKKIAEIKESLKKLEDQKEELAALRKTIKGLEEAIDECRKSREANAGEFEGAKERVKTLEKAMEGVTVEDGEPLREAERVAFAEKKSLQEEESRISARLLNNEKKLADLRREQENFIAEEAKFTSIKGLADTIGGTLSGAEKVKLETYVQMQFFDRIIERANTRLMVMSGGRYRMIRRREATSKRGQSGLDLNVIDYHNGTERDIKTLSGGEGFDASLALALGLSDEIQSSSGGIQLDSMFVDEGFGSLDPEALDRAMTALADLAEGNRLVGVISHVEEMKNRIQKQIQVTKNDDGTSTAKVV